MVFGNNRPLSLDGHVESQENKKLCFCTASLALNVRSLYRLVMFQTYPKKYFGQFSNITRCIIAKYQNITNRSRYYLHKDRFRFLYQLLEQQRSFSERLRRCLCLWNKDEGKNIIFKVVLFSQVFVVEPPSLQVFNAVSKLLLSLLCCIYDRRWKEGEGGRGRIFWRRRCVAQILRVVDVET